MNEILLLSAIYEPSCSGDEEADVFYRPDIGAFNNPYTLLRKEDATGILMSLFTHESNIEPKKS